GEPKAWVRRTRLIRRPPAAGIGIESPDIAGAVVEVDAAALRQGRADRDCRVHRAREAEVADRPAIDAAPDGLELLDDLHGADLRRAGERAGGKGGAEGVEAVAPGRQLAADGRDEVYHVRVALDPEALRDLDAPRPGHPADGVAPEVEEH